MVMKTEKEIKDRLNEFYSMIKTQNELAAFQSPNGVPQGPAYQAVLIRIDELEFILNEQKKDSNN